MGLRPFRPLGLGARWQAFDETQRRYILAALPQVAAGQVLIFLGVAVFGWAPFSANLVSFCVTIIPAYLITARYIWAHSRVPWQKGLPAFTATSLAQLFVSSAVLTLVTRLTRTRVTSNLIRAGIVNISVISAMVLVWVGRYFVLDRLVFARHRPVEGVASDWSDPSRHSELDTSGLMQPYVSAPDRWPPTRD